MDRLDIARGKLNRKIIEEKLFKSQKDYRELKKENKRLNEHLQAQINNVADYTEVLGWVKEQPWFNHESFNHYVDSRVFLPVDN